MELADFYGEKKPVAIKSKLPFPVVVSSDGKLALFDLGTYKYSLHYLGTLDNPTQRTVKDRLSIPLEGENLPTFSPDNRYLLGWRKSNGGLCIVDTHDCSVHQCLKSENLAFSPFRRKSGWLHYAFMPNGTIIIRDDVRLYICTTEELISTGEGALELIHNNDAYGYPFAIFYKPLHAFSNTIISCVMSEENGFDVVEKSEIDSKWVVSKTIKTAAKIRRAVYACSRMLIATQENGHNNRINFYHFADLPKITTGSIDIESLYDFVAAFAPDSQYLACRTDACGKGIVIINCSDCTKPFICDSIALASYKIFWIGTTIYAKDSCFGECYEIDASLVTGYTESKKSSKKESNNYNA